MGNRSNNWLVLRASGSVVFMWCITQNEVNFTEFLVRFLMFSWCLPFYTSFPRLLVIGGVIWVGLAYIFPVQEHFPAFAGIQKSAKSSNLMQKGNKKHENVCITYRHKSFEWITKLRL